MARPPSLPKLKRATLLRHDVCVDSDNAFQQRARLLQALWRAEKDLPVGDNRGKPLGSAVELQYAVSTLCNFLTDTIREVVRHDVLGPGRDVGSLIREDRLFANLLSSQPLCFNLFGELARDLNLAGRVLQSLMPGRIACVTEIRFEHAPGRSDPRYTGDRSAFDVFVRYESPAGKRGFLGIEVKYHEALNDTAAEHRARYDELADAMGCFAAEHAALRNKPLQQIWRDHLLSGALLHGDLGYDEGSFVFLYPRDNEACAKALAAYRTHLTSSDTFSVWTLEDFVSALRATSEAPWIAELDRRYLDFPRAERACSEER